MRLFDGINILCKSNSLLAMNVYFYDAIWCTHV